MTRTAVVLLLIMPMAASSAMMPEIVAAVVSPSMAIMSRPTEQTQVMASSFSMERLPCETALIIPSSSLTGMNAPERPPTWDDAMRPPFFTASLSIASAAVVPGAPHASSPISSRMRATLSPTAGVGASERSMMPNGTPRRLLASRATIWPTRVILNAVFLMVSATSVKSAPFMPSSACFTTPGPLTPTLTTLSPSLTPWNAPAMNGLSPGALQNTTSFAQPSASCSRVSSAVRLMTSPISRTQSILMPAFVEPRLTEEQTISVVASACGMDWMRVRSPFV